MTTAQFQHYERLWPAVEELVEAHASDPAADRLVLEGSGVLPARVAACAFPHTAAYWLTADPVTLGTRVHTVSGFEHRSPAERLLIEKFLGRTKRYNDLVADDVRRSGLCSIDIGAGPSTDDLVGRILTDFSGSGAGCHPVSTTANTDDSGTVPSTRES